MFRYGLRKLPANSGVKPGKWRPSPETYVVPLPERLPSIGASLIANLSLQLIKDWLETNTLAAKWGRGIAACAGLVLAARDLGLPSSTGRTPTRSNASRWPTNLPIFFETTGSRGGHVRSRLGSASAPKFWMACGRRLPEERLQALPPLRPHGIARPLARPGRAATQPASSGYRCGRSKTRIAWPMSCWPPPRISWLQHNRP